MFPQLSKQKDEYEVEDKEFLKKGVFLRRGIYQKGRIMNRCIIRRLFYENRAFLLWGVLFFNFFFINWAFCQTGVLSNGRFYNIIFYYFYFLAFSSLFLGGERNSTTGKN